MKVFCFGNEFLENDSLAKEIADELIIDDVEFIKCDSPDEIFLEEGRIIILDVVEGIDDVIIIEDIDKLSDDGISSLHDFDLRYFLKLKDKIGQINEIKIIGIPMRGNKEEIKEKIKEKIKEIR